MSKKRSREQTSGIREDELVSDAVLRTIQTVSGDDVMDMPPLQEAVDVEAVDRLCEFAAVRSIEFAYHGFDVTVSGDQVTVSER